MRVLDFISDSYSKHKKLFQTLDEHLADKLRIQKTAVLNGNRT